MIIFTCFFCKCQSSTVPHIFPIGKMCNNCYYRDKRSSLRSVTPSVSRQEWDEAKENLQQMLSDLGGVSQ